MKIVTPLPATSILGLRLLFLTRRQPSHHKTAIQSHTQCTDTEYTHRSVYLRPKLARPRSANELTVVSFDAAKQSSLIVKVNKEQKTLCLVIEREVTSHQRDAR